MWGKTVIFFLFQVFRCLPLLLEQWLSGGRDLFSLVLFYGLFCFSGVGGVTWQELSSIKVLIINPNAFHLFTQFLKFLLSLFFLLFKLSHFYSVIFFFSIIMSSQKESSHVLNKNVMKLEVSRCNFEYCGLYNIIYSCNQYNYFVFEFITSFFHYLNSNILLPKISQDFTLCKKNIK